MKKAAVLFMLLAHSFANGSPELVITEGKQILINHDGKTLLASPSEGLWTVALDWKNDWPSGKVHAVPSRVEEENGHKVFYGELELDGGKLSFRDVYKVEADGVRGSRRVEWHGEEPLNKVTLSVRFIAPAAGNGLVVPGVMYHGNPNGTNSGRTATYAGKKGEFLIVEEHRLSMPYVSLEWEGGGEWRGAALHSFPSPVDFGNQEDQWWTIGAAAKDGSTELLLLSGPAGMNREPSTVKAHQGKKLPMLMKYPDAYLTLKPGAIIEKSFFLQVYPVNRKGNGLETPTLASIQLHKAHQLLDVFPSYENIVAEKYKYAQLRWLEGDDHAGYNQFETGDPYIVWGWVGQAAAPGYAMQHLWQNYGEEADKAKVQKSLDFLSDTVFYEDGFYTWYNVNEKKWQIRIWRPMPEWLSQGQGMWNLSNAIRSGRQRGYDVTKWEGFLKKACDFYADRILSEEWNPKSTNEGFFIAPLAKASTLFNSKRYLKAARHASDYYAKRHLSMDEPYWGGTLDASCEDKEGAFAAFQGFMAMYETTGDEKYLDWAKHAGMVCLTYLQVWDIDMPAGRLRDHHYKSRGWTTVSVQNHHLDVYGVLIAPDVYRLGKYLENSMLKETAKLMFVSCGQLMDHRGSQGEQIQQTFFAQHEEGIPGAPVSYRGDYVEDWTVFWITAHFLNAAAQFEEMKVEF